jgi:hypothetical protein
MLSNSKLKWSKTAPLGILTGTLEPEMRPDTKVYAWVGFKCNSGDRKVLVDVGDSKGWEAFKMRTGDQFARGY